MVVKYNYKLVKRYFVTICATNKKGDRREDYYGKWNRQLQLFRLR